MPANTAPIYTLTPHVGSVKIGTTSAVAQSDGASTGATTNLMYCVFAPGANGSLLYKIRFNAVASAAAVTSVATTLRIYMSTAASLTEGAVAGGATTAANTMLLAEIAVPAVVAASTNAVPSYFEVVLNIPIPSTAKILVQQHVAQTTNQQWQAVAYGGDY